MLVSTRERETAAESLRRHFVNGRLSLEEFNDRVRLALDARDARQLRRALRGLPPVWRDGDELRSLAARAKRRAVIAIVTVLWALGSLVLLFSFAVGATADTPSAKDVVGYAVGWLVLSALAWRVRRRA
ncbi:MAG TPA: DUF1707 domain-containing protein [Gaiellaceae bacterium]|nr:DUF1707 domain-containing protein [Gaiellaceae bacterium]